MDLNITDGWTYSAMLEDNTAQYLTHIAQSSSSLPSTPHTVDDESSPSILETQPTQQKAKRQGNFTTGEDIALISAWLNTSMNPRKGTDKKATTFLIEITRKFCDITKTERTERSLTCRFGEIQRSVNKFIGIVAQIENSAKSGYNEQDKIQMAKSMYLEIHKTAFRLEHCWNILRNQPKWMETEGVAGRKKKTGAKQTEGIIGSKDSPTTPSSVDLDNEGNFIDLERPIGTKAAKEKERQKKRKWENDCPLGSLISDWKVHKLKMHDDKMKIEEEKMAMAKRDEELRLKIAEEKMAMAKRDEELRRKIEQDKMMMAKRNEELKIMTMDLNNFDNDQKEYIMMLRATIMDKQRNQL